MRLNLVGETLEDQLTALVRDLEEIKAPQFTSQNSGLLGRIVEAGARDSFGDIVQLTGDFATPPNPTSHIPCPATPSPAHFNSIYCYQSMFTEHDKPAVVVPFVRLAVDGGGLHGESAFILSGYRFLIYMGIYNASNVLVGELNIVQDLGDLLEPKYNASTPYAWQTVISYTCTQSFELSYKLLARSSDRGYTETEMEGLFF